MQIVQIYDFCRILQISYEQYEKFFQRLIRKAISVYKKFTLLL